MTSTLRTAKKKYYSDQFHSTVNNIRDTWKVIRNVFKPTQKKSDIHDIRINGELIENRNVIVDKFNDFFCSIGPNLSRAVPHCEKMFSDYLREPNPSSLFLFPTNEEELFNVVNSLKKRKSPGYDGISNDLIKNVILGVVKPLVHIYNLSMNNGIVPVNMKIAKVIPIFKKGDPQLLSNYRPISLLSTFSKILEKLIYVRTVKFFNVNQTFSNFQFGFREKHTTSHAILHFIDKISTALDNRMHTVGIFLDYSKAFDTVDHTILLQKLSHHGVRGKALEWFTSYLSNRRQFVSLNDAKSGLQNVTCGVPQGSLLGPLLFLIYINDFQYCSDVFSFILFADDSNIFLSHKNPQVLLQTVNIELSNIITWIHANKLSLNFQKTNYMLFSNSVKILPGNVLFGGVAIDRVNSTKFLGLYIDDKLNWKIHVNNICKLLSRNTGVICKLKRVIPKEILFILYSTLILPYLNYGILAWGNSSKSQNEKLFLIQKRVIRIICNVHFRTHTNALFHQHKILKVEDIYFMQLGSLMYDLNAGELPLALAQRFKKNSDIHRYNTRQASGLHLPRARTQFTLKTLVHTGPRFWNSLDASIKHTSCKSAFKRRLKFHLLNTYCVDS